VSTSDGEVKLSNDCNDERKLSVLTKPGLIPWSTSNSSNRIL